MPANKLAGALKSIDWQNNVAKFLVDQSLTEKVAGCNYRLGIWAKQIEISDLDNPALPFIREMQISGHHVSATIALALYKSAAASMRSMLETAIYYTYFRKHPMELATLSRDSNYFIQKSEVVTYHTQHTPNFAAFQEISGLKSKLNNWYKEISGIVHGQIPGKWGEHVKLKDLCHNADILQMATDKFCDGVEIVHLLFLGTLGKELWPDFASEAKKSLLHGMDGKIKELLMLEMR